MLRMVLFCLPPDIQLVILFGKLDFIHHGDVIIDDEQVWDYQPPRRNEFQLQIRQGE